MRVIPFSITGLLALGLTVLGPTTLGAQPTGPHTMSIEPMQVVKSDDFEWSHEIQVALPPSYHSSDRKYPTLWITDGSLAFEAAVGILQALFLNRSVPEMIIVGVGAPGDIDLIEFSRRRSYEFSPNKEPLYEGLGGDLMRESGGPYLAQLQFGGAGKFLDFLVDDLRPRLSAQYRMDPEDHGLYGLSGGGMFVGYAIFARPGSFSKYICGSPSLYGGNFAIFDMEEKYAEEHDDLDISVFFGAGEREIHEAATTEWNIVSSMVRLAETLSLRRYPSLEISTRIFAGEGHYSVAPLVMSWGVRTLWGDEEK